VRVQLSFITVIHVTELELNVRSYSPLFYVFVCYCHANLYSIVLIVYVFPFYFHPQKYKSCFKPAVSRSPVIFTRNSSQAWHLNSKVLGVHIRSVLPREPICDTCAILLVGVACALGWSASYVWEGIHWKSSRMRVRFQTPHWTWGYGRFSRPPFFALLAAALSYSLISLRISQGNDCILALCLHFHCCTCQSRLPALSSLLYLQFFFFILMSQQWDCLDADDWGLALALRLRLLHSGRQPHALGRRRRWVALWLRPSLRRSRCPHSSTATTIGMINLRKCTQLL